MFLMILSGNKDVSFTDILIAVLEAKALEKLFQSFSECFTIKSNISMPYHCCYWQAIIVLNFEILYLITTFK